MERLGDLKGKLKGRSMGGNSMVCPDLGWEEGFMLEFRILAVTMCGWYLERCPSGRWCSLGKAVCGVIRTAGSNPALSGFFCARESLQVIQALVHFEV